MESQKNLFGEIEEEFIEEVPDSEEPSEEDEPIAVRKLITQPYDLALSTLRDQVKAGQIYLRPLHERPHFQRFYVWNNKLASLLIESILLNIPIPPCYFSQNEDYSFEVIDGQQRIFSIFRFLENQFSLTSLEVLKELNNKRFHELEKKIQRQLETHILRCVVITNDSSPEIQFDVFERLNSNTVPLNAQELRNCMYRGSLNDLVNSLTTFDPWLSILGKQAPDRRMRDSELILRFFAFHLKGYENYKTPQKHWLNDVLKEGRKFDDKKNKGLENLWKKTVENCLIVFDPPECFRRWPIDGKAVVNRALMDLTMQSFKNSSEKTLKDNRDDIRNAYRYLLLNNKDFDDLISKSVDHKSRTIKRFQIWNECFSKFL